MMRLQEVLEQIITDNPDAILRDSRQDWNAADLRSKLSVGMLLRPVHMLPGVYIAALSEAGLMGEVLYRFKAKG